MNSDDPYSSIFGALMPLLGVFDGELVEVELLLQHGQLARFRILDGDPDEAIAAVEMIAHLAERNVASRSPRW